MEQTAYRPKDNRDNRPDDRSGKNPLLFVGQDLSLLDGLGIGSPILHRSYGKHDDFLFQIVRARNSIRSDLPPPRRSAETR